MKKFIPLLHSYIENSSQKFPNKTALIYGDLRISYNELNKKITKLSSWLQKNNITKGDRIVILMENCIEYVVSYYAIMKAGGIAVPLSTDIQPETLQDILNQLEAKLIIFSQRLINTIESAIDKGVKTVAVNNKDNSANEKESPHIPWNILEEEDTVKFSDVSIDPEDIANIIYTSGSTGKPKGVVLTHKNITTNVRSICRYLNLTDKDIQMVVLPFFYVMGKSLLNTHMAVGGTVVINNKFAYPASVINQMIEEKVTGFSGVPSTYAYLLHRSPLANKRDELSTLRYCSQAGGHMSRQIKKELRSVLPDHTDIVIMYGATEASARLSYLEPKNYNQKMDSIGKAIPGVQLKIVDEYGEVLPPRKMGELVASGENIMQGYWKDPEGSAMVLSSLGYHTGDLGFCDEEGYIFLSGRKDSLIKVGGHRINPQEVEDYIMSTGDFTEVAVLGIPDELLGNKLAALLVPKDKDISENSIITKLKNKLPAYKVPGIIKFTRMLPKKAAGKIDRNKCKSMLEKLSSLSM